MSQHHASPSSQVSSHTHASSSSRGASSGASPARVQMRSALRGQGFVQQEAALAPRASGAPVQRRAAVQREPNRSTPDGSASDGLACHDPNVGGMSTPQPAASTPASSPCGPGQAPAPAPQVEYGPPAPPGPTTAGAQQGTGATPRTPAVYNEQDSVGTGTTGIEVPLGERNGITNSLSGSRSTANGGSAQMTRDYGIELPTLAIPIGSTGLHLTSNPSLKATVGGGVNGLDSGPVEVQAQGSVSGQFPVGLEFGAPPHASFYLRAAPVLQAQAQITLDRRGVKSLDFGTATLDATLTFGAQINNGMIDDNVQVARANIGRFSALRYERGSGFTTMTFVPGQDLDNAIAWMRAAEARGRRLAASTVGRAQAVGRRVASTISDAWAWLRS